jgi:hypothetical protein
MFSTRRRTAVVIGGMALVGAVVLGGLTVAWAQTGTSSQPSRLGMGAHGPGMMGAGGMMGGAATTRSSAVTMPEAVQQTEQYLAQTGNSDLTFDEVEEYTNNFYVAVREQSTGTYAFELLIDPATGAVWREPGPDMMWNTKYGMMAGYGRSGMMGGGSGPGMMGGYGGTGHATVSGTPTADTPGTADQATSLAQAYLDNALPGTTAGDAHAFYGFRTIEVRRDGQTVGMLSVNGYTGAVWYHTWHGDFVQEWQRPR